MPWILQFLLNGRNASLLLAAPATTALLIVLVPQLPLAEEAVRSSPPHFPPPPAKVVVRPPEAPRSCHKPRDAILVSDVEELQAALADSVPQDIWLADGTYSPSSPLAPKAAHRLWGSHANNITLRAGLNLGSKWGEISGFEIHCLTLEVTDESLVHKNAILSIWGSYTNTGVYDSRLVSDFTVGRAINASKTNGLHVERVEIAGFNADGIRIRSDGGDPAVLMDLDLQDIELPGPDDRNGTAEAGIFMKGKGIIERIRVRNAYWMGVGVYAHDVVLSDLDIDGSRSAIYLEHYSHRAVVKRFHFGSANQRGMTFEWDDPDRYSGQPTTVDAVVQDGVIEAAQIGVAVMDGQVRPTVQRVIFRGQCGAAIIGNRQRSTGEAYVNNVYLVAADAHRVTSKHPSDLRCD
jgi:hypothetical protein